MYNYDAKNYGLDRDSVVEKFRLSAEQSAILSNIDKFLMNTGYYDTAKMHKELAGYSDLGASFASFFGDTDEQESIAHDVPEIDLAEKINAAWDVVVATAEKAVKGAEFAEIMKRVDAGKTTLADREYLVSKGLARYEYGDPDSNAPTRIVFGKQGDGNTYADQVDAEVRSGR